MLISILLRRHKVDYNVVACCHQVSLSLLMMDGRNDEREHFSLKDIQEKEKMTKRKRRKKREAEVETVPDTFQVSISIHFSYFVVYSNYYHHVVFHTFDYEYCSLCSAFLFGIL